MASTKRNVKKKDKPTEVATETYNAVLDALQYMRDDDPVYDPDVPLMFERHVQKLRDAADSLIQQLDPDNETVAPAPETPKDA